MFIRDSRRSYITYRYSELILITYLYLFRTPVGATELILKLRSLHLFGDTRGYHRDYVTHTGISERILVLYRTYSYTKVLVSSIKFILVLRILYLYYEVYSGLMEHILILQILSLCEGTRRYNKSELIIIVSHTGLDQTYTDTYQVWTLVRSRYRS